MTENPPPPSGIPQGDGTTPPPPNPYGTPSAQPSAPPPAPQNPYASQPPASSYPYAGNAPTAGQSPYGAEAYPVSPGGPAPVAGAQPAGLGSRFLARLIDGLLFGVISLIIGWVSDRWVGQLVAAILYLGYYVYMESSRGQTLGKQLMKLRVHGASGGNPTTEEAFRRNAFYLLSVVGALPVLSISFIFGLASLAAVIAIAVTINSDPLKRGWHDKFANTTVTKEG